MFNAFQICQSTINTSVKTPINQGFSHDFFISHFLSLFNKATADERRFLEYVVPFVLHRKVIYVSNGYIADKINVKRRSVIRYFKKYWFLFDREERYQAFGKRRRQTSSKTQLTEFASRIEVLRWLARYIKAIRKFPYLLLTGIVSASMLLSQSTGMNAHPLLSAIGLSHLNITEVIYKNKQQQAAVINLSQEDLSTKKIQGESAERGIKTRNFTKKNESNKRTLQKRSMVMLELPDNIQLSDEQQAVWLAIPQNIQQKALQRLQAAALQNRKIHNLANYLLSVARLIQQDMQEKQPSKQQQKTVLRPAPPLGSIEERAQKYAQDKTAAQVQQTLTGRRLFVARTTTTGAEKAHWEGTIPVLERALEICQAQEQQQQAQQHEQPAATEQPITHGDEEMAKLLGAMMPDYRKDEVLLMLSRQEITLDENPVMRCILRDYLKRDPVPITS